MKGTKAPGQRHYGLRVGAEEFPLMVVISERWFSTDADYVALELQALEQYRARYPDLMAKFESMLRQHFDLIDKVEDYRWQVFEHYARRA